MTFRSDVNRLLNDSEFEFLAKTPCLKILENFHSKLFENEIENTDDINRIVQIHSNTNSSPVNVE